MTWAAVAGLILCAIIFTTLGIVVGYSAAKVLYQELEIQKCRQYMKTNRQSDQRMN